MAPDNPQLKLAAEFVQNTGCHVFLTGKAGTGKTTFLHNLKRNSIKRMVVLAPTGVAAINAGGVTIHSFFQLPFGPQLPAGVLGMPKPGEEEQRSHSARFQRFSREKINIIKSLELLVIDEISMVRADLLDAIDEVLRRYRDRDCPFGGLQLLMIGDLQQLAPVVKGNEWSILQNYYDSPYFFSSRALQQTDFVSIELKHIYRQQDEAFIRLLNKVRDNRLDEKALRDLNSRHIPGFSPSHEDGYITLTTHNFQAQEINLSQLNALKGKARTFKARLEGEFPAISYPTDPELTLKVGAQVMFVKNDPSPQKLYYNGKIGKVTALDEDRVQVICPGDTAAIAVEKVEWQNCRYALDEDSKEIKETVIGSFIQEPLKLAWAITIHKSQGLTFEKAVIDAHSAFAHGQVYVALSRCRTLEGLVLSTPISPRSLKSDNTINQFIRRIEENNPGEEQLAASKNAFQERLLLELFDFSLLQRPLGYLLKLLRDNLSSIDAELLATFTRQDATLKAEVAQVSDRFKNELRRLIAANPDVEKNELLQERIRKACGYFSPRIENDLLEVLPAGDIETDNKILRKSLREALLRLRSEARIKIASLAACKTGFNLIALLQARAKAVIDVPAEIKAAKASTALTVSAHPEFYRLLKAWKDQTAEALGLPGHRLLPLRTMKEIATTLPATRQALRSIKGMGEKKVKSYGAEILKMTLNFRRENNMELPRDEKTEAQPQGREKGESRRISFDLFLAGRSVQEIAAERNLAQATIEGHLSYFVGTGQLSLDNILSAEKIARITEYFTRTNNAWPQAAKAALGADISYGEINCVLKHLEYLKATKR